MRILKGMLSVVLVLTMTAALGAQVGQTGSIRGQVVGRPESAAARA